MPIDTTFIDELASAAPTPGGGGASAYCGALSAALASMVTNLTIGKKTYAAVESQMVERRQQLDTVRARFVALIDADAQAFAPLAACYRMPNGTPAEQEARAAAMQAALVGACDVPIQIMETCAELVEHCEFVAEHGSRLALSDAAAAAVLARAAVQAASLNVFINVKSMESAETRERYLNAVHSLLTDVSERAERVYEDVQATLR